MNKFKIVFLIIFAYITFLTTAMADLQATAHLMILDKVTAQSKMIKVNVGTTYAFNSLDIRVVRCDKAPPEDVPESAVFLEITESERSQDILFKGWMFASNPSINSFEHAVYDVWLKSCQ